MSRLQGSSASPLLLPAVWEQAQGSLSCWSAVAGSGNNISSGAEYPQSNTISGEATGEIMADLEQR